MKKIKNLLILGCGGIGSALAKVYQEKYPQARVFKTYRTANSYQENDTSSYVLNPTCDESWKQFTRDLQQQTSSLDLIIVTWGQLGRDGIPEKQVRSIDLEALHETFAINCFAPLLAMRELKKFVPKKEPCTWAFLSAKVGSIADNRLGGWYSYRASKAALNMSIKTMALELKSGHKQAIMVAIHPGTTKTKLSADYIKRTHLKVWGPQESAQHIAQTIEGLELTDSGSFKNWDGTNLPW